ncbi:DUF167 domain-containing protein [Hansschlegelia plantiphila]|uniref:UPF0235 protein GCM10008179_22210 n=1 Tax=Hansschlegelia plantiphila TaxID=374655 RepID=A0A9W6J2L8_9HYPH|nr:DUF167 domain-containing protein [Hansschlegelia plantiphila]GLK68583.1 hypothetical protein GCM10008179_22210 [Hansschlegelia plantiphila]
MSEDFDVPNPRPFVVGAKSVRLRVRVTPRASRDALGGVFTGPDGRLALQARLAAPPVDGAANAALVAMIAKTLRLRKADVAIASGETSRMKVLELSGDVAAIKTRLEELAAT